MTETIGDHSKASDSLEIFHQLSDANQVEHNLLEGGPDFVFLFWCELITIDMLSKNRDNVVCRCGDIFDNGGSFFLGLGGHAHGGELSKEAFHVLEIGFDVVFDMRIRVNGEE